MYSSFLRSDLSTQAAPAALLESPEDSANTRRTMKSEQDLSFPGPPPSICVSTGPRCRRQTVGCHAKVSEESTRPSLLCRLFSNGSSARPDFFWSFRSTQLASLICFCLFGNLFVCVRGCFCVHVRMWVSLSLFGILFVFMSICANAYTLTHVKLTDAKRKYRRVDGGGQGKQLVCLWSL